MEEITIDGTCVRIYPFFRSAPANFVPSPSIDPKRFPFRNGLNINVPDDLVLASPAMIPLLGLDNDGKATLLTAWGTETDDRFPKDSLRIDVLSVDERKGESIAEKISQDLLETLRVLTSQYWIGMSPARHGRTATFEIDKRGVPTPTNPTLGAKSVTISGDESLIDSQIWKSALKRISNCEQFYPLFLLILDARQSLAHGSIRRAILDAAIACEQARDIAFENLWNGQNPSTPYRHSKVCKSNDFTRHISDDLSAMSLDSISYEDFDRTSFSQIKRLWQTRNNVAHGRSASYFENGKEVFVDRVLCRQLVAAANSCCNWLLAVANLNSTDSTSPGKNRL